MEYVLYLSESKIEMLYSQLPQNMAQQVAAEIGGSLGIVSAKLKTNPPSISPFNKAKVIERSLEVSLDLGSIAKPREWIKDVATVRYIETDIEKGLFALVAKHNDDYFLFGGSARNVIGNSKANAVSPSLSFLPYFLAVFKEWLNEWEEEQEKRKITFRIEGKEPREIELPPSVPGGNYGASRSEIARSIGELYRSAEGVPEMKMQIVAKKLTSANFDDGKPGTCYIYSPLYVTHVG